MGMCEIVALHYAVGDSEGSGTCSILVSAPDIHKKENVNGILSHFPSVFFFFFAITRRVWG